MEKLILAYFDFNKMFKLYIDALDIELGVVLIQENDNRRDQVVYYEAKTLLFAKKNYLITKKKCLVIIWTMQKFKHFLRKG